MRGRYAIIDIFSRYIVGWTVAESEGSLRGLIWPENREQVGRSSAAATGSWATISTRPNRWNRV
jgi:hypothetical protein